MFRSFTDKMSNSRISNNVQNHSNYCKFGNFREGFIFAKLRNGEITLSITDIVKSFTSREFLAPQECLLTVFAKIKFSRKFPDLQYMVKVRTRICQQEPSPNKFHTSSFIPN